MRERYVGMSRNARPASLLSTIRGREKDAGKRKLEQQPEDITAPPMPSEDESEEDMPAAEALNLKLGGFNRQSLQNPNDSEPDRGDIKRTSFSNSSTAKTQRNTTPSTSQQESDAAEASSTRIKRRKVDAEPPLGSASHLKTKYGFIKTKSSKVTFGSKKGASQSSRVSQKSRGSQGSQGSQTKKGKAIDSDHEIGFQHPKNKDLPDSPQSSDKAEFKTATLEPLNSSPIKSRATMKTVPKDDFGTPEKAGRTALLSAKRETSPSPAKETRSRVVILSQDEDLGKRRASSQHRGAVWDLKHFTRRERKRQAKRETERQATPEHVPVMFITPVDLDDGDVGNTSIASSPVLSDLDQLSDTQSISEMPPEDNESHQGRKAQCPWCGDLVSEQSLKDYSNGKRLNVQMQTRFCAKHKKETAMETWNERGYPFIDWDRLEGRLGDHREYLSKIVHGKQSHFRDIHAGNIETGQVRSLKKEGNLNPGYYGPRGCKLMCDYLVDEFGELLKQKAAKDWVIAGRGSAAFIQSVLVAELAVQLIMEDMLVSASDAREIMEESKPLGELIHEEV
ncbi:hypothetical protein F66182_1137 [Fusarium sp. NRRL 66182]|nr:hypothetical protein F66182_1137 [Fusarium sp. NRRL 66182]